MNDTALGRRKRAQESETGLSRVTEASIPSYGALEWVELFDREERNRRNRRAAKLQVNRPLRGWNRSAVSVLLWYVVVL